MTIVEGISANGSADGAWAPSEPVEQAKQELVASGAVIVPPPPVTAGQGPGRRYEWKKVPESDKGGYENYFVFMWMNFPATLANDIDSRNVDRVGEALSQIYQQHNHWKDETGAEYPQPGEVDGDGRTFWERIPNELVASLITMVSLESTNLSFLATERRATSRRR